VGNREGGRLRRDGSTETSHQRVARVSAAAQPRSRVFGEATPSVFSMKPSRLTITEIIFSVAAVTAWFGLLAYGVFHRGWRAKDSPVCGCNCTQSWPSKPSVLQKCQPIGTADRRAIAPCIRGKSTRCFFWRPNSGKVSKVRKGARVMELGTFLTFLTFLTRAQCFSAPTSKPWQSLDIPHPGAATSIVDRRPSPRATTFQT
jgi:hypothetical protein